MVKENIMLDPRLASLFNLKQSDLITPSSHSGFIRGLFKYPGSKYDSLPELMSLLPYRGAFVDVFGGSGCVILSRNTEKLMVFNDVYHAVVDFYRAVRDKPQELVDRLLFMLHSREEWENCKRTWQSPDLSDVEKAARWYYLVQYSFIGKQTSFGRITGKSDTRILSRVAGTLISKLPLIEEIHRHLINVQIEQLDFRVCIEDFDSENSVIYCDPPYYKVDDSSYTNKLSAKDHKDLLDMAMKVKGFIAISGYANSLYDSYNWTARHSWTRNDRCLPQAVSGNNSKRKEDMGVRMSREEILWIKDNT